MNKSSSIIAILITIAACGNNYHRPRPMIPIFIERPTIEIKTTPLDPSQSQGIIIDIKNEPQYSKCQSGMNLIKGNYCPNPKQECLEWLDNPNGPAPRCQRYRSPTTCQGSTVAMEYCMDVEELHDSSGIPYGDLSWNSAKVMCEKDGKRLCNEPEWNFACEGTEMLPFPYGFERRFDICNLNRKPIVCGAKICDHRANISEFPECLSPFKIHNLVGNVDEMISVPYYSHSKYPGMRMRSVLKGGHFIGYRNNCRSKTQNHSEAFTNDPSIGSRCCSSKL